MRTSYLQFLSLLLIVACDSSDNSIVQGPSKYYKRLVLSADSSNGYDCKYIINGQIDSTSDLDTSYILHYFNHFLLPDTILCCDSATVAFRYLDGRLGPKVILDAQYDTMLIEQFDAFGIIRFPLSMIDTFFIKFKPDSSIAVDGYYYNIHYVNAHRVVIGPGANVINPQTYLINMTSTDTLWFSQFFYKYLGHE